jgi:dolichol-phosphate mannosyltransferase
MKIGIVIPPKNEQDNIKALSKSINKNLKSKKYLICFIDKSDDEQTIKLINKYFNKKKIHIIKEKKNKSALTTRCAASNLGFKWFIKNTNVDILVDLDADLAQDPKEINQAIKYLKHNDVVIASKYLKKSIVIGRSKLRRLISYICTLVCQIIITNDISDFSNSYRFYKRRCIEKILKKKIIYQSPIQHLENLIILLRNNYKIKEMPTKYIERERGQSSIKVVGLYFYFLDILHCLMRYIFKKTI